MPFFDIFSSKKEERDDVKIIVDFREKNSLVPSELLKQNLAVEFSTLPIGDYLTNGIAIERKTLSDLKSSIIDKRIFSQMRELKQYPSHLIIIEGKENIIYEIKENNILSGFILSALIEYKIPIIYSNNEKETANYIKLLAKRVRNKNVAINPKKIYLNVNEQKQYVLESFPGIGPVKAKALLEKFNSLEKIFSASEEELEKILKNKAKDFLKLFRHRA